MQDQLYTGETLNYTSTLPDYPASSGWGLTLVLNPRTGGAVITFNSAASGDEHLVQVAASATAAWAPGTYAWEIWAIKALEKYRIDAGQIQILQGLLGAAAGVDTRSLAEKALDNVTTLLHGKATSGVLSYQINGRQLSSYSMNELLKLEAKLKADVNAEYTATGRLPPHNVGRIRRILTRIG